MQEPSSESVNSVLSEADSKQTLSKADSKWYSQTLKLARDALQLHEVPVACIIVYENNIIGRGKNKVNETKNATRHAEIEAIDEVLQFCTNQSLESSHVFTNCTLYVTMEPCVMCAAALRNVGVARVISGCFNDRFGGCGSVYSVHTEACFPFPPFEYISGIEQETCVNLIKEFYATENPNVPAFKSAKRK